ncbi:MAG: tRNA uridine-5-carboxymethylaminomethyl(34) synthesis GTPase MnmE [Candidatus Krumholzibacteria bacterium]|nr:tRNA uridine-5-carboxymethylaminomethyl(34) synthesis GTPase MnmE [Candidatus Krumholzibacteria bacterium]
MSILRSGTIIGVATPAGRGGLAVVRISGPEALAVARQLLPAAALADPVDSHRARLAMVQWPQLSPMDQQTPGKAESSAREVAGVEKSPDELAGGAALDQVLVLPMLAPASYTGEDVVEFHCHGGLMPARLIMAACQAAGARAAGPGEFTRRAFVNGRLSLAQAEAVADLIAAEHTATARAALAQLRGGLNRELAAIENPLRELLARLEGSLEFSEAEAIGPPPQDVRATLLAARRDVERLLSFGVAGRQLREGVQVVLTGPPNAGKSSLFNALLGQPRALIDAEPGTTRDVITASLELGGVLFVLHDTAGLRDEASGVEALGIDLARERLAAADIVLDLRRADSAGWAQAREAGFPSSATVLKVWTMADLRANKGGIATSAKTGEGIAELRSRLLAEVSRGGVEQSIAQGVLLNQRHQDRLRACLGELVELLAETHAGDEVVAALLGAALQDLGAVSGRVFSEQMLDEVFSRFCVGK